MEFSLGQVLATPGVLERIPSDELQAALKRHVKGDWGKVDKDDWLANDAAVYNGSRLHSVYAVSDIRFWIITEADRSVTTLLLPSEY